MTNEALPDDLARQLGIKSPLPGEMAPTPELMLDWALHYARRGIGVFPTGDYTGTMLIDRWYHYATTGATQIADWWTQWPDADIACVPDKSGHFVILAVGDEGRDAYDALEEKHGELTPAFIFKKQGTTQYWFSGAALSSSHKLGKNLFVFGPGRYLFLPPSSSRVLQEYVE